jgi:signal peptidase I
MNRLGFVLLAIVIGCLAACAKRSKEDQAPAGSSSMTRAEAESLAALYALRTGGSWAFVGPTGSMAPVIDSHSVLLLERYKGQKIVAGDIVVFDRGDVPNVCHRVVEVKDDAFYVSGDNNQWPDGWFKLTRIQHRVAGVLYTER